MSLPNRYTISLNQCPFDKVPMSTHQTVPHFLQASSPPHSLDLPHYPPPPHSPHRPPRLSPPPESSLFVQRNRTEISGRQEGNSTVLNTEAYLTTRISV